MAAAVALGSTLLIGAPAHAAPAVGQKAPDFVAMDTRGAQHKLSDFAGKYVVLEWTNPGCPFVRKHYGSGNMPATQKAATDKGVVWLAINSTERAATDYLKPDLDELYGLLPAAIGGRVAAWAEGGWPDERPTLG